MKIGNCLIAAVIAKIKNPKNTKIIIIPKGVMKTKIFPHFVYLNKAENTVSHYVNNKKSKCNFLYFGKIHIYKKEVFDRFIDVRIRKYLQKQDFNLRVKLGNLNFSGNFLSWHPINDKSFIPTLRGGTPFTKSIPFIEVLTENEGRVSIESVRLTEDKTVVFPQNAISWRYITPALNYMGAYKCNMKEIFNGNIKFVAN
ncbi:hypothetical protein [Treponema sp.]|uniref:hypothetical protein n=1 Tax=Treponema sp. TaxID=166 RepID=UPI003F0D4DD3